MKNQNLQEAKQWVRNNKSTYLWKRYIEIGNDTSTSFDINITTKGQWKGLKMTPKYGRGIKLTPEKLW